MDTFVDTQEDMNPNTMQEPLASEQQVYWNKVIGEAHYDPNEPKEYITLEEYGEELLSAVRDKL